MSRQVKRKRYNEAALMRTVLDVAREYLELQHLRIEAEKAAHGAEFQFPNWQNSQPIVDEHADIALASLDILLGDGVPI